MNQEEMLPPPDIPVLEQPADIPDLYVPSGSEPVLETKTEVETEKVTKTKKVPQTEKVVSKPKKVFVIPAKAQSAPAEKIKKENLVEKEVPPPIPAPSPRISALTVDDQEMVTTMSATQPTSETVVLTSGEFQLEYRVTLGDVLTSSLMLILIAVIVSKWVWEGLK